MQHVLLERAAAALHDVLHLQVAGGRQVVHDLLRAELQDPRVAGEQQVTDHRRAVEQRHLEGRQGGY